MPYILSPEQKVVVDALLCNKTSSTKYFDIISAMQSICKGCISILKEDKNVLIHIPDNDTRKIMKEMFELHGLHDLAIDLSDKNSMPEVDIIKLRSALKKQKNTDAIISYVLSIRKEQTLKSKITEFYSAFDVKVMADVSFRDFAANAIYKKKIESPILQNNSKSEHQLQYSATEYYNVKKEINTAIQIYHRQYDLYDHLSLFKDDLWVGISDTSILRVKEQLNLLKEESALLVKDFNSVTNVLLESSTQELTNTFANLEDRFLIHEEACIAFQIKSSTKANGKEGMFSIFKKKKTHISNKIYTDAFDELSGLIQAISQEWFDELDAPTTESITYDYISNFIKTNREKTIEFKEKIHKNLQDSIQRINKINTTSQDVKSLDRRLGAFIQKMNESKLFDLHPEHNILSFLKQVELSKDISGYIEKCHILVNSSSSYPDWKSFYGSTGNIFRLIFEELKKSPKNVWNESFENWYENQIHSHVLDQKTISIKALEDYFSQANLSNQFEVSSLIANLHTQRIQGAELLKETSKELYNTLFKKKQLPSTSWRNTALLNRSFMQSFFPIHISDSISYSTEYDRVISFSNNDEDEKSDIHYFSPIESKDIQNISEKKNFLYLNDYNYNRPLAQLSSTDKLKASKKLAKFILSLNQNIKIYQLKCANIISLLPSHDDSYLELELDKRNVKVIDTNGVLYDRLTESILFTERKPFLIIKDQLINSELHEYTLWQLKILRLFRDVGYEVLSVNTTAQIVDNANQFDKILQKIGGSIPDQKEKSIQKFDEQKSIPEEV